MKSFDDLERLDSTIEGLKGLLELLYVKVENMEKEDIPAVCGAVYALQEYAEHMDCIMQAYQHTLNKGGQPNEV